MFQGARMVVCMDPGDFRNAVASGITACDLRITGHLETRKSHNVIGILPATTGTDREFLITCHLDGYQHSPGANDNGTGIGTLIELARVFANRPQRSRNIRFVAFGAEESGLLGSRMYVSRHRGELAGIDMVFNVDTIGGTGDPRVEMGSGTAEAYGETGACHFPEYLMDKAWEGRNGKWRLCHPAILPPLLMASILPEWLETVLADVTASMDFKVDASGPIFSDGRAFAQAGVPTSGIAQKAGSALLHSENDTPANLNPELIRKCVRITHDVVIAALNHFQD